MVQVTTASLSFRVVNSRFSNTDLCVYADGDTYWVNVCKRGSYTNFGHGGPLDVRGISIFHL